MDIINDNCSQPEIKMNDLSYKVTSNEAKKLRIVRIVTSIIAAIATISGAVAVFLSRDSQSRYWGDTPVAYVFCAAIALGVVCAVACLFIFKPGTRENPAPTTAAQYMINIISCAALFLSAFTAIAGDTSTPLKVIVAVSAIIAALVGLRGEDKGDVNFLLVGTYAKTIFCVLIISALYLDLNVEMNSPFKLVVQFAAATVALHTLCDARRIISGVSAKLSVGAKVLVCVLGLSSGAIAMAGAIFKGELIPTQYFIYSAYFTAEAISTLVSLWHSDAALSGSI
jgi:hypothetical protein